MADPSETTIHETLHDRVCFYKHRSLAALFFIVSAVQTVAGVFAYSRSAASVVSTNWLSLSAFSVVIVGLGATVAMLRCRNERLLVLLWLVNSCIYLASHLQSNSHSISMYRALEIGLSAASAFVAAAILFSARKSATPRNGGAHE